MPPKIIEIKKNVLEKNDTIAKSNRDFFLRNGITVLNFTSSPGSGKTSLLENSILRLKDRFRIAVLEGDQYTGNDAERIARTGVEVLQINTLSSCHLDASMIRRGLEDINHEGIDFLFIENVGNLVCPASYDLGELMKVVVISTTEGEDKPEKYPKMFLETKIMIITKIDLIPHLDFDIDKLVKSALSVNPHLEVFKLSNRTKEGFDKWIDALTQLRIGFDKNL